MALQSVKNFASRFISEVNVYRRVMAHPRFPKTARILLSAAVFYAISPVDLIPDFIPIIGHLDDAVVIPVLVFLSPRFLPDELVDEVRAQMAQELKKN